MTFEIWLIYIYHELSPFILLQLSNALLQPVNSSTRNELADCTHELVVSSIFKRAHKICIQVYTSAHVNSSDQANRETNFKSSWDYNTIPQELNELAVICIPGRIAHFVSLHLRVRTEIIETFKGTLGTNILSSHSRQNHVTFTPYSRSACTCNARRKTNTPVQCYSVVSWCRKFTRRTVWNRLDSGMNSIPY